MCNSKCYCKVQGLVSQPYRKHCSCLVKKISFLAWSKCTKRGSPLYLPEDLDQKICAFIIIIHMQIVSGTTNCHVDFGLLIGLIKMIL